MAASISFSSKKLKSSELILLFTSLSYILSAGMTPRDGLEMIRQNEDTKINPKVLNILCDELDAGLNLSEAFKAHEDRIGSGFWHQLDAAERTGKVPECMLRIASQLKNSGDVKSKIRGALLYPTFVLIVACIAGYYLLTTTIPEMGQMMVEMGGEIPPLTAALMKLCDMIVEWGWLILLVTAALVVAIIWALSNPLKLHWHHFITKFILSGSISVNLNYSIAYTLINDMIENGSNIVSAVRVAAASVGNYFIQQELISVADTMDREGLGLAKALQSITSIPGEDRMMLDVGSRTGREMELLIEMADRRRVSANTSVAQMLELFTPIIMVLVCALVGVLVVAVYMPMLTMASALG